MQCLKLDTRRFFLCGLRFFFGSWLLYTAFVKWIVFGPNNFVGMIVSQFDPTWSPHILNVFLAWLIIFAETILSVLILVGLRPRLIWSFTACLMFLLTIGQTILMKPDVIANWQYLVLTLTAAAFSDPDV